MRITEELINVLAPKHGRTSCSDENLCNGHGGWTGYYSRTTGQKEIQIPRCIRCYLQTHAGYRLDELDFRVDVVLSYKGER